MKDDRVNFKMQEAKMMRFFKRIFLSSTQSYCCMQFRLLYHSSPLYENEAIVIQMGELCQQCAFDAWGIRYYTTHDHRLCTLPHADVSQRGVKFFIKSHFKLLQKKIMSLITVNLFQKVTTSCCPHLSKIHLTLGPGSIYYFYKETGCIKTIKIWKTEVRIQNANSEIFLTPL
jgi:hypothetical protein